MAPHRIVVVGASLAGLRACEAARRRGYDGRITLVGAEPHLPYDRPPLSKAFLDPSADAPATSWLPGADALTGELGVDLVLGEPAVSLDVGERTVATASKTIGYDALLVATGAAARTLPGAGDLTGVHTLRTLDDARAVRSALDDGSRTVVVGAGFIGAEVASAARKRGLDVTVLESESAPLARAVGRVAGSALGALHGRHGTTLNCGVPVDSLIGTGEVTGVRLVDGTEIPADLVVVGIGAVPVTDWLSGPELIVDDGLVCDETLRAGADVWAAGDVARWSSPDFGVHMRLEHWTNASEQAGHAVANLLDPAAARPYRHVPYFWSDWYDSRIQFVGVPRGEPEVVSGTWDEAAFAALYRDGDRLVGALTLNRRSDIMKYRALIARQASWSDALELATARNARR